MNLRRKRSDLAEESFDAGRCECGSDFHVATLLRPSDLRAIATWKSLPHSIRPQNLLLGKLHALILCTLAATLLAAPLHAAERDEAIQKVRNSLRQENYPWYDKSRDAAERFSPEKEQEESDRKKRWRELLSLAINIAGLGIIAGGLAGLIYWLRKFTAKNKKAVRSE